VDHRGRRDPGLGRDGGDAGARVALLPEQLDRGVDEVAAPLDAALLNLPLDPRDGTSLFECATSSRRINLHDHAGK